MRRWLKALAGVVLATWAIGLSSAHAAPKADAAARIELKVGGKQGLQITDVVRVVVSNPDVAEVRVGPGPRLEVSGRASGSTVLTVVTKSGTKSYAITVAR